MHTLVNYLLVAAIAPSMALTQEPPTPPKPPTPARAARPPLPPVRAAAPKVYVNPEPELDYQQREAIRELEMAQRETRREIENAQRDMERDQAQMQRGLVRAQAEMQRSLNAKATFSEDRFSNATPRQGWAKTDPADSLYRVARETLNRGEYRRAATAFNEVGRKYPQSQYALDSQYWEAFARYRAGTTEDLKQAQKLLEDPKLAALRQNEDRVDIRGLRARILAALAARGDAAAARALQAEQRESPAGTCDREEVSVRAEALNALGQMDPAGALPTVKKVLARRDECTVELRRRALYILGRIPSAESVPIMLEVAKNDSAPDIRREAMSWLSRTAGDQAVPMLEDLLRTSNDLQTQRSAVSALGSIDTERARRAIRAIIERSDVQENVRAEAISSLARERENRVMTTEDKAYLRSLYAKMETQRLKQAVLSAVSRVEAPENEAWLLGIAKNENEMPSLRSQAIERLGRMTTVSFAEIGRLYEIADSRSMRQQILRALSERKEPEAVDKLVEVAKKDTDPNIRSYAIQILSRSNNPKALQALKDLLP